MNKLYQQLNPAKPQLQKNISNIRNMMRTLRGVQNPNDILQQIATNNPQMGKVLSMVKTSGKSPKDLFYSLAQEKGVDPNEILRQLQQ